MVNKKLLVMRFSALGDVAMTVPVITQLAQQHPELRITVLTRIRFVPLFEWAPSNVEVKGISLDNYKGIKVFDMSTAQMADVTVPPWFDDKKDVWVFGIASGSSGFAKGADYGWLVYPEQTLPAGYVFAGSYNSDGNFTWTGSKARKVHFLADGTVEDAVDFPVYEVSAKKTRNVSVDGNGKVTIAASN